jgi:hypothetical protein
MGLGEVFPSAMLPSLMARLIHVISSGVVMNAISYL